MKTFFVLRKSSFPSWFCRLFLEYSYPNLRCDVFNLSSLFNFSAHNTRSLSSHEQVRLIRLCFEILYPSFTKKAWKCIHLSMCSDPKNFLEVAKGRERLQQNALVKLRFSNSDRASLLIESFLLKLNTITLCFEHDIFHNNLKDKVYGQVYSYQYCRLLPKKESITNFLVGIVLPLKISTNCPWWSHFLI